MIIYKNIIIITIWHVFSIYGIYRIYLGYVSLYEILFHIMILFFLSCLGITAGSHRLWSHCSYKAKLPLRIFLMFLTCLANQKSIYSWARDHRVHHKASDTDADPHNIRRGLFFSHMGWFFVKKNQKVIETGKTLDFNDLENDRVVMFQHKYFFLLSILVCYVFPSIMGYLLFKNIWNGLFIGGYLRHVLSLHSTWCVNSIAHTYGYRPYDESIRPTENKWVSFFTNGEGFHNYHHKYPFDYSASELKIFNVTTWFIDLMEYFGLVYDKKRKKKNK